MDKFSRSENGYNPEEVNKFLDQVIKKVEEMITDLKIKNKLLAEKDSEINELKKSIDSYSHVKHRLEQYERMESTLNNAILMAQKTSDQIKYNAHKESEIILEDAKKNASRIVNESLLKAEKHELEADMLKRNVNIFKKKLRNLIESQLEMVDDIEKVEF